MSIGTCVVDGAERALRDLVSYNISNESRDLAICVLDGVQRSISYYDGLAKYNYLTGFFVNIVLHVYTIVKHHDRDLLIFPLILEVFCVVMWLGSIDVACFKTSILTLATKSKDVFVKEIDGRINELGKSLMHSHNYKFANFGLFRFGCGASAALGFSELNKKRFYSMLAFSTVCLVTYLAMNIGEDSLFLQKAISDCKV